MLAGWSRLPCRVAVLVAFALVGAGCYGGNEHESVPRRPVIVAFGASPVTVQEGSSTTLSWSVSGATSLSISPVVGAVTGTRVTVLPSATTTYVLTATNAGGSSTSSVTVTVTPRPSPPVIVSFTASPPTILPGGSCTLSWSVTGATSVSIDQGVGVVSGATTTVTPAATTTYTLTATNAGGPATAQATVTVGYAPPTSLSYANASYAVGYPISPDNVPTSTGGPILAYAIPAGSPPLPAGLSLDAATGIISGTPTVVTPAAIYTITGSNPAGSATANVTLAVIPVPPLVITTQPADQSALPPSTATFTVAATGVPPLSYQWRKDGTVVPGATSASYTTPPVTRLDDGSLFDVVVTDAAQRSVTSATALLLVRGFVPTGSMLEPRSGHTATLLFRTGMVLVAGGDSGSGSLATAELYDPTTGLFSATGSMTTSRVGHAAVELDDGRVLLLGGCIAGPLGCTTYLDTAEIYDPDTGAFTATGSMAAARTDFAAELLGPTVLVAGGFAFDSGSGSSTYLTGAEIYDPLTGTFSSTGSLQAGRRYPMSAWLFDGTVLVAGGSGSTGSLASAELYDPAAGVFTPVGPMSTPRNWGTATTLASGDVLVAGGIGAGLLSSTERYQPATGTFAVAGSMGQPRALQAATLLPITGEVLLTGGTGASTSAEIYDPVTDLFEGTQPMPVGRSRQTATLLPDGNVLIAGGDGNGGPLRSADLWGPPP